MEEGREIKALSPFLFPFSRPNNFSRAFFFRVFPTIWEPGTGYAIPKPKEKNFLVYTKHNVFDVNNIGSFKIVCIMCHRINFVLFLVRF